MSKHLGRAIGNAIAAAAMFLLISNDLPKHPKETHSPNIFPNECLRLIDVLVYGNFEEMLDHLKADENIRPVYYARIEVNVYGGFVFTYTLHLDQVHWGMGRL